MSPYEPGGPNRYSEHHHSVGWARTDDDISTHECKYRGLGLLLFGIGHLVGVVVIFVIIQLDDIVLGFFDFNV